MYPNASTIKATVKSETFGRKLGDTVELGCEPGYIRDTEAAVKAICKKDTYEEGKWESEGECICFEPDSMQRATFLRKPF